MPCIVGITTDVSIVDARDRAWCTLTYADAARRAGGTPILLVPDESIAAEQLALCDAVVLTGGDDPRTEAYGVPTHPRATPVHPRRQAFETRLLALLDDAPRPTLGVCLGMQMMALHAGGVLDQHMPDTRADAARHWGQEHEIMPEPTTSAGRDDARTPDARGLIAGGVVHSRHRQAVAEPGRMRVLARADDGVVEAIDDPARRFYVGVQWHPERTTDESLGLGLFRALIAACSRPAR